MFPIQVTILTVVLSLSFATTMAHFPPMGNLKTRDSEYMRALPGMLARDSSGEFYHHTLRGANAWDRTPNDSAGHILSRSVENGRLARRTLTLEQVKAMVEKLNEEIGQLQETEKGAGIIQNQSGSRGAAISQGFIHPVESKDQKLKKLEERKPKVVKAVALLEKEGRADDAKKLQTAFSRYTKATEDALNMFSKDSESGRKSPSSLGGGMNKGLLSPGKGKRR